MTHFSILELRHATCSGPLEQFSTYAFLMSSLTHTELGSM